MPNGEVEQMGIDAVALPFMAVVLPEINSQQCLNGRHKASNCVRCVHSCPVAAIQLSADHLPVLGEDSCVRCGACVTTCPTDVFQSTHKLESKLLQTVAQLPNAPIALVCALHPSPSQTIAPGSLVVQHQRCLAALDPADLLALSNGGQRQVWLDDAPCANCPIGQVRQTIEASVTTCEKLGAAHNLEPAVRLVSQLPEETSVPPKLRTLIDGSQPKVSRRGLFRFLQAHQNQKPSFQPVVPSPSTSNKRQRLPQTIPASRSRLLAEIERLPQPVGKDLLAHDIPFATVSIAPEQCSGCSRCALLCPTGAIYIEKEANCFELNFQATLCIDCAICVAACPEDAVTLVEELSSNDLHTTSPHLLVHGTLRRCTSCGVPTLSHPQDGNQPRCHTCRQGAGIVTAQKDEAGLMVDLIMRSASFTQA